jgi:ribosomal protein S1
MCSQGQEIEAVVLGVSKEDQKVSLSVRQLDTNPWEIVTGKYPTGTRVKGKVRNLTAYGAFVELEEGIDGMIHVSDLSWTRKINHPSEMLKKGDDIEAEVLEIDKANQRISLSLKHLADDPWKSIESRYKIGDLVTGKVSKVASFGAFIQLADEIDGLVHISQISNDRVEKVKEVLKIGQEVSARVIKVDKTERRIGLSIKAADYTPEQIEREKENYEALKPGEELSSMEAAFDRAEEDYRPGESKKTNADEDVFDQARRRDGRPPVADTGGDVNRRTPNVHHAQVADRDIFEGSAVDFLQRQPAAIAEGAVGDGAVAKAAVGLRAELDPARPPWQRPLSWCRRAGYPPQSRRPGNW